MQAKATTYVPSGSGRDSYISKSNGGFYPPQEIAAYQNNFKDQLRLSTIKVKDSNYLERRHRRMASYFKKERALDDLLFRSVSPDRDPVSILTTGSETDLILKAHPTHMTIDHNYAKVVAKKQLF